jgi:polar amino acid transport system substrate-binding protein
MTKNRLLPTILTLTIAAVLVIAGILWYSRRDTSLSRLQAEGVIRIGYAVEAPYAFLKPGQEVSGESPEVAKRIVSGLGIGRIEWRQIEFGALIGELQSGRIDVIAAGMFITPERAQVISFSEPTFHVRQGLLVAKGNPLQIHSYEQFTRQSGLKIAVLAGSIEERLLEEIGVQQAQRILVPDALTGRVAVESGIADGLALSSLTIQWMVIQDQVGKTEAALPFQKPQITDQGHMGYGAFGFRKRDAQLIKAWNAVQENYIGSPDHLQLITPFGFSKSELPGSISTKEIIRP